MAVLGFIFKVLGPTLVKWGLGFLVPDYKRKADRLADQMELRDKAETIAQERKEQRNEIDKDVSSSSADDVQRRLRDRWINRR